jgi:hypothetical protein
MTTGSLRRRGGSGTDAGSPTPSSAPEPARLSAACTSTRPGAKAKAAPARVNSLRPSVPGCVRTRRCSTQCFTARSASGWNATGRSTRSSTRHGPDLVPPIDRLAARLSALKLAHHADVDEHGAVTDAQPDPSPPACPHAERHLRSTRRLRRSIPRVAMPGRQECNAIWAKGVASIS